MPLVHLMNNFLEMTTQDNYSEQWCDNPENTAQDSQHRVYV